MRGCEDPMAVKTRHTEADHVVLLQVTWDAYQALVEGLGEGSSARLTYDGQTLESMSPGSKHERVADRLGDLVSAVVTEWKFNIEGTGLTTFQQPGERGFVADKSYYIASL